MTEFVARVDRWRNNRYFISLRMVSAAEPHIMAFCGRQGEEQIGKGAAFEMLQEMIELGHPFTVRTEYVDVSLSDMVAHGGRAEDEP
jgi:hypothetical protein